MSRRTDITGTITPAEAADLMAQAEALHALNWLVIVVVLSIFVVAFLLFGEAAGVSMAVFMFPTSACNGRCRQGRDCTCSEPWALPHTQNRPNDAHRFEQRSGGSFVNTDQMLATGAIEGPFTQTKPLTLTVRQRLARWVRRHLIDDMPRHLY